MVTPSEEASQLIRLFKEEEMYEYDVTEQHAIVRAHKCCSKMMDENKNNAERYKHLQKVGNILIQKLR